MRKRLMVGLLVAVLGLGATAVFGVAGSLGGGAVHVACASGDGYCGGG